MSVNFTNANKSVTAAITAMDTGDWTLGGWFFPTSTGEGGSGAFISAQTAGNAYVQVMGYFNSGTQLYVHQNFSTTAGSATSNGSNLVTLNQWNFVLCTYRDSDKKCRIFLGTQTTPVAEVSGYTTQVAGVGTRVTAGTSLFFGNVAGNTADYAGKIARQFMVTRELSVAEMLMIQLGVMPMLLVTNQRYLVPFLSEAVDLSPNRVALTDTSDGFSTDPAVPLWYPGVHMSVERLTAWTGSANVKPEANATVLGVPTFFKTADFNPEANATVLGNPTFFKTADFNPEVNMQSTGGPPQYAAVNPEVNMSVFGVRVPRGNTAQPPADFISYLLGPSTRITRRAVIYESDGATVWKDNVPIIGGSVSVDATRPERRTLSVTFDNEDGSLNHAPNAFWYDKVIKVWRGMSLDDDVWEAQLGEFCIDQISTPHFPPNCTVTGRDYTKRCLISKLRAATSFAEGQTIEGVIEVLATNAGITKFLLPNTGKTMGRQFFFDAGTNRWDAMTQIATAFGYELYFNAYGYLVLREFQDPISSPQQWTFDTGADTGSIVGFNKVANDTRIYNHIVVRGESNDTPPVWAEAINNVIGSPTRVGGDGNPGGIGDRVYEYVSSFFTSTQQCQDVADKFLAIHALESYEVNIESLVLAWLDVGNIVEFIDPTPNPLDPIRFLLSSFEIPLALGTMTCNTKRVTVVS